jgi:GcrA cell cycle regulator
MTAPNWTAAEITRLRFLWAWRGKNGERYSSGQIAQLMNKTKNAISGQAHRLGLEARESPIKRGGQRKAAPPKRVSKAATLPKLNFGDEHLEIAAMPVPVGAEASHKGDKRPARLIKEADEALRLVDEPLPPAPVVLRPRRCEPCCWPIGEPGRASFRYCDAESLPGRAYCASHDAIAFVRGPRGGEVAA